MFTQGTLERIRHWQTDSSRVLSVYLNVGTDAAQTQSVGARLRDLLKPIESTSLTLDHRDSASLVADIKRVLKTESRIEKEIGHGVAIFACDDRNLFEYITLPRAVWDVAIAARKPYLRPLVSISSEPRDYLAVVVDRWRAQIFEFEMGDLSSHEQTVREGRRKKSFAGWYGLNEYGARHHASELESRHYRETASRVSAIVEKKPAALLFVGGHRGTLAEFLPFLTRELHDHLAGTFIIDPHTMTPAKVERTCSQLARTFERDRIERTVAKIVDAAARDGFAVQGARGVLDAANAGAIEMLVLCDAIAQPGVACDACGWLGIQASICPVCSAGLRTHPDIFGDLVEAVIADGGAVSCVASQIGLNEQVGAVLRFRVRTQKEAAR